MGDPLQGLEVLQFLVADGCRNQLGLPAQDGRVAVLSFRDQLGHAAATDLVIANCLVPEAVLDKLPGLLCRKVDEVLQWRRWHRSVRQLCVGHYSRPQALAELDIVRKNPEFRRRCVEILGAQTSGQPLPGMFVAVVVIR